MQLLSYELDRPIKLQIIQDSGTSAGANERAGFIEAPEMNAKKIYPVQLYYP
jgi:hypothetical protein